MLKGHCRDMSIGCGRPPPNTVAISHKAPPHRSRPTVEWQYASIKLAGEILLYPFFKSFTARLVPNLPCASNQFSQGLGSKKEICRNPGADPVEYCLLGVWPDGFADNVGVE